MLGVDSEIGTSAMRLWVAAGSAASLVIVCALAFGWGRIASSAARFSIVALGAVLGAAMAWAFLGGAAVRDQGEDRRALEMRAAELNAQSLAPGSPLACLDAMVGENVETACEKALFAAPATVAAATSYVTTRFALLSDMVAYTRHGGANIDNALLPLRHALETDRFGFVAHALALRDGCTSQNCKVLELLHDSSRVRANLSAQTLDRYLDHYLTVWAQPADGAVAEVTQVPPAATAQPGAQGPRKVTVNIDFPTAASIPAVSIMNPEPKGSASQSAAAAAAAAATGATAPIFPNPNPLDAASSSRKSRKQAAKGSTQATAPVSPAPAEPVDPVWTPAPAAPAAGVIAPVAGAPVQLNPASPPPEASAGAAMRAQ
jgi:hypothetical protein